MLCVLRSSRTNTSSCKVRTCAQWATDILHRYTNQSYARHIQFSGIRPLPFTHAVSLVTLYHIPDTICVPPGPTVLSSAATLDTRIRTFKLLSLVTHAFSTSQKPLVPPCDISNETIIRWKTKNPSLLMWNWMCASFWYWAMDITLDRSTHFVQIWTNLIFMILAVFINTWATIA